KALANQEFFDRLGRRVVGALTDATADGFVFRVDMRLRPYGDAGPLSSSFAALENYLVTQGRTWERYAWLKARTLTGNRGEGRDRPSLPSARVGHCRGPPWLTCPRHTSSCAISNTGCSIETIDRLMMCPPMTRSRRRSPAPAVRPTPPRSPR